MRTDDQLAIIVQRATKLAPWRSGRPSAGIGVAMTVLDTAVRTPGGGLGTAPVTGTAVPPFHDHALGNLISRHAGAVWADNVTFAEMRSIKRQDVAGHPFLADFAIVDTIDAFCWGCGLEHEHDPFRTRASLVDALTAMNHLVQLEMEIHRTVMMLAETYAWSALVPATIVRFLNDKTGTEEVALAFEGGSRLTNLMTDTSLYMKEVSGRAWATMTHLVEAAAESSRLAVVEACRRRGMTDDELIHCELMVEHERAAA